MDGKDLVRMDDETVRKNIEEMFNLDLVIKDNPEFKQYLNLLGDFRNISSFEFNDKKNIFKWIEAIKEIVAAHGKIKEVIEGSVPVSANIVTTVGNATRKGVVVNTSGIDITKEYGERDKLKVETMNASPEDLRKDVEFILSTLDFILGKEKSYKNLKEIKKEVGLLGYKDYEEEAEDYEDNWNVLKEVNGKLVEIIKQLPKEIVDKVIKRTSEYFNPNEHTIFSLSKEGNETTNDNKEEKTNLTGRPKDLKNADGNQYINAMNTAITVALEGSEYEQDAKQYKEAFRSFVNDNMDENDVRNQLVIRKIQFRRFFDKLPEDMQKDIWKLKKEFFEQEDTINQLDGEVISKKVEKPEDFKEGRITLIEQITALENVDKDFDFDPYHILEDMEEGSDKEYAKNTIKEMEDFIRELANFFHGKSENTAYIQAKEEAIVRLKAQANKAIYDHKNLINEVLVDAKNEVNNTAKDLIDRAMDNGENNRQIYTDGKKLTGIQNNNKNPHSFRIEDMTEYPENVNYKIPEIDNLSSNDFNITYIIDDSGSANGGVIEAERKLALALSSVFSGLEIPLCISSFKGVLKNYEDDFNPNIIKNIIKLQANTDTPARKILMEECERQKVFSKGEGSNFIYFALDGDAESVKDIVEKYTEMGIHSIGLGILEGADAVPRLFGEENSIGIPDLSNFKDEFLRKMKEMTNKYTKDSVEITIELPKIPDKVQVKIVDNSEKKDKLEYII